MTYRESFDIGKSLGKVGAGAGKAAENAGAGAGKAVGNASASAGKAAANAGKTVGNKVVAPIGDFFKKIWGWLKFVVIVCWCCCIASVCFVFGIPQMLIGAASSAAAAASSPAASTSA